jgi:hypothetical protein
VSNLGSGSGHAFGEAALFAGGGVAVDDTFGGSAVDGAERGRDFAARQSFLGFGFDACLSGLCYADASWRPGANAS